MDAFFCVPQTIGLVRGEPKEGQKNRANGRPIMMEALEERATASPTIERDKSGQNVYGLGPEIARENFTTRGEGVWDWTVARADEYRSVYVDKNGKERSRKLPKQSIIALAYIIKPPEEVMNALAPNKRTKFLNDSLDVLEKYDPVVFGVENRIYGAYHNDEGGLHFHGAAEMRDEEGRYIGSRYDAKWRQGLATFFAQEMRERGWPVLDPKLNDWEKYNSVRLAKPGERGFKLKKARDGFKAGQVVVWANPDYRREVDEKKRRQGLSVSDFHARKEHEKALNEAEKEVTRAVERANTAQLDAQAAKRAQEDAETAKKAAETARATAEAAQKLAETARATAETAKAEAEEKCDAAQTDEAAAKARLESLKKQVAIVEGNEKWVDSKTKESHLGLAQAKAEVAIVEADLTHKRAELNRVTEKVKAKRAELEKVKGEITEERTTLSTLQAAVEQARNQLATIFERLQQQLLGWWHEKPWREEHNQDYVDAAVEQERQKWMPDDNERG